MGHLNDKVAVVTGGGQGVGFGIASALADCGASVAVVGRTADKLESAAKAIAKSGGSAAPFTCDVKDPAAVSATVDAIVSAYGRIDILVNNAQEVSLGPLLGFEDPTFKAGFASGPLATFRLMKACHPHLKRGGDGVIVNLTSSATRMWNVTNYGLYAAVKEAIVSLTRTAAVEWGVDGIRTMAIAPFADSPALKTWLDESPKAETKAFLENIPLRRVGRCREDIGAAVAALCRPEFGYLTGGIIPLDGGQANFS
jgi:NAD(P)-dependent dehydrogenase (short-subunit alcohol dehydrogenase family)